MDTAQWKVGVEHVQVGGILRPTARAEGAGPKLTLEAHLQTTPDSSAWKRDTVTPQVQEEKTAGVTGPGDLFFQSRRVKGKMTHRYAGDQAAACAPCLPRTGQHTTAACRPAVASSSSHRFFSHNNLAPFFFIQVTRVVK